MIPALSALLLGDNEDPSDPPAPNPPPAPTPAGDTPTGAGVESEEGLGVTTEVPDVDVSGYSALASAREQADTNFSNYQRSEPADVEDIKAGSDYITPGATVAGQLKDLLDSDSPLMQQAETAAQERSSALGMMSSSSGVGATQGALYKAALPIAKQDAEVEAKAALEQQKTENRNAQIETEARVAGDLTLQKAKLQEEQKKITDAYAITLKGLDTNTQNQMNAVAHAQGIQMKELTTTLEQRLLDGKLDSQVTETMMAQSHDMMNQYQITVQQLMGNQSFMESQIDPLTGASTLPNTLNTLFKSTESAMRFTAQAADIYTPEMQSYIDDLVADNEWNSGTTYQYDRYATE